MDVSIGRQDEHRWRRHSIAKQVIDTVVASGLGLRVSQYGVARAHHSAHLERIDCAVRADRQQCGVPISEFRVCLFQLTELVSAYPSEEPSVEHQHDGVFVAQDRVQ